MLKRVAFAIALWYGCGATGAFADDADVTAAASGARERTFAELSVDGVDRGQTVVWILASDVYLPESDAARGGIPFSETSKRAYGNGSYVSLASLAPGVTFAFDPTTFRLVVSVRPALLGERHVTVGQNVDPRATAAPARPASGFANYVISAQSGGAANGLFETGLSRNDEAFYSSESVRTGGSFERGTTYFSRDDATRLRRTLVGDTTVVGDALLGEVDVFGAGVRRLFEIDPYAYRFPTPSVAGLIAAPGTADVYVNGLLAKSIPLQPGGFNLGEIPVATGRNDVAVVVRDTDGNVRTYRQSYFSTDALLRKGLTDYDYGVGFLRDSGFGDAYGRPALAAAYRAGVSDDATLGFRFASTSGSGAFEATSDLKAGSAIVHLAEAASDVAASVGFASDVSVGFTGRTNAISASAISREATFRTIGANVSPIEPARFELELSASQRLANATSVALSVFRQTFASLAPQSTAVVTISSAAGPQTQLVGSFARSQSGSARAFQSFSLSAVRSLGNRASVATAESVGNLHQSGIEYRLDPPSSDAGFGYDVRYDAASGSSSQVAVTDHTPVVDLTAYVQRAAGAAPAATVTLGGSVVAIDGHVLASRPVGDAFALVESGDVGGVPVVVDGRPVGNTNRSGFLVVPSVGAFAPTRVSLDIGALPLGIDLARDRRYVAPGFHGGSVASFRVERVAYYVGTVRLATHGAAVASAEGTLELTRDGVTVRSSLDDDGAYYFENLAPGRYRAVVRLGARTCAFELSVPRASGVSNDLGSSACAF